ncbi:MAG: glycogen/starch synthase [Bacteroidaceae bacterium]|nr:glycogen/starch synthase [Bacteroidaceae bacterium]
MTAKTYQPDFVFQTSWEVCNKVGGIYTVLSSIAKTLSTKLQADSLCFIGPDIWQEKPSPYFTQDDTLLPHWRQEASKAGIKVRIGRWRVPGEPIAVLVDFTPYYIIKDQLYGLAWENFGVDSLHAYGDYDEASMFSYAAGKFVETIVREFLQEKRIVYQAHEWMSGLGMLFLKNSLPNVATVFTTHATSIGRSITGNNKQLYTFFSGYNGDQMARELNMEAKHSIEKQSAHRADCFTTVSTFTANECTQLLEKTPDVVLPNGFEADFVPSGPAYNKIRREARKAFFQVAEALTGAPCPDDTLVLSTSGRNDFRCKGFDVYLESMARLNAQLKQQGKTSTKVLALIEVPCWCDGPREDLLKALQENNRRGLPEPNLTHHLVNPSEDRILSLIKQLGLSNAVEDPVKVLLVPCYLEGADGLFNKPYYNLLTASDLCIYPSYYEPWGYTPHEAVAFHIPCITTDLSGFGQWVNQTLGHQGTIDDGVMVLHRDDENFDEVCNCICEAIHTYNAMPSTQRTAIRRKATALAHKADWKHFVRHYLEAYNIAINKTQS